jgi:competence protein ComEC
LSSDQGAGGFGGSDGGRRAARGTGPPIGVLVGALALLLLVLAVVVPRAWGPVADLASPRSTSAERATGSEGRSPYAPDGGAPTGGAPKAGASDPFTDPEGSAADSVSVFELHILDVGQGDAILMRVPDGRAVLVDGGEDRDAALAHLQRLGVEALELVVASHNHADHIGGLIRVFEEIPVRFYMDNGIAHDTRTYERLLLAVEASGAQLLTPEPREIRLGPLTLRIFPPSGRVSWGQNDNSVGVLAEVPGFRAFMGGDAEPRQWDAWLRGLAEGTLGVSLDGFEGVQVLKASHHGSRNGDTAAGLQWLRPEVVVISLARENRYGHPHEEALARYREAGVECVLTTAELGTVSFRIPLESQGGARGAWRARVPTPLHPTCS